MLASRDHYWELRWWEERGRSRRWSSVSFWTVNMTWSSTRWVRCICWTLWLCWTHGEWIEKVVVDGATVVSGGWDQRAVFWVKTPQNLFFSFVFRNWKGVSTSSVRRWSWTPTSTSSQLALPMSTMWGGKVDTWQNCQNRSSSAFMLSLEYTSTLLLCYSSLFSVKASWISLALSTNSWWASLFLNST